ncbi:MAG: hypothetical protein GY943_38065 [Chloroflexi bacterium]|nr:hypothetical protein [Chloroflexota bacterium]
MDTRPALNKGISVEDFKSFYWLKAELVEFCKKEGLNRQGSKIQIADTIAIYLKSGKKESPAQQKKPKPTSTFDWNNAPLSLETIITDNYKNSENVRAFFQNHIDKKFRFNVKFMNWMKQNMGKTLADAIQAWHNIELEKKVSTKRKEIAPQFEYNRYIRDFLEDNPGVGRKTAVKHWQIKRSMRGDNIYKKSDLLLKEIP